MCSDAWLNVTQTFFEAMYQKWRNARHRCWSGTTYKVARINAKYYKWKSKIYWCYNVFWHNSPWRISIVPILLYFANIVFLVFQVRWTTIHLVDSNALWVHARLRYVQLAFYSCSIAITFYMTCKQWPSAAQFCTWYLFSCHHLSHYCCFTQCHGTTPPICYMSYSRTVRYPVCTE